MEMTLTLLQVLAEELMKMRATFFTTPKEKKAPMLLIRQHHRPFGFSSVFRRQTYHTGGYETVRVDWNQPYMAMWDSTFRPQTSEREAQLKC
jgi:hypothetical protein